MVEVVFNDSIKGSMKVAKDYNKGTMIDDTIRYTGEKTCEKDLKSMFDGEPVECRSQDVVGLDFGLDAGDISGDLLGEKRKQEFTRLYGSASLEAAEAEKFFHSQQQDFEKLLAYVKNGEPIRVWKSAAPYSACGFAWLCNILQDFDCKISVVSLQECWQTSAGTHIYADWGEIPPGQLDSFLPLTRCVSANEKNRQIRIWRDLKTENAALRALVNGYLISVPEDFYDHLIMRNLPDGDFIMARLIGDILGRYPIGVGDCWYALRINKMIADNLLKVVADKDPSRPYGKVLRKIR
ncbi:MAG: DUF3658 domain-containing protein [Candidatus Pelethousia sp.]|nr:DUF3658 domain-containing protein [Candidatus Pelethousia sp.]